MAAAAVNGSAAGADAKAAFGRIYGTLKEELLKDPAFEFTTESHQWIDRVMLPPLPSLL
jgi:farnesyl diphosphate synthase